jgi:hypothetical protein
MTRLGTVLALSLAAGTASAQTLDITGACPGPVRIDIAGITVGGNAAILVGAAGAGDDTLGVGPCVGTETGLRGIRYITTARDADRDGRIRLEPTFPAPRCSVPIQVLDISTCALTNVVTAAGGGGCGEWGATCALVGEPDPATVFNVGEVTYFFDNNLVGSIWHADSGTVLAGHYNSNGRYQFPAFSGGYPALPALDTGVRYGRMVHAPRTGVVVRSNGDQFATLATDHTVGVIDPATGDLSGFVPAVYSDGFGGYCNLISASATEFLCFDGADVRHYATEHGSGALTHTRTVSLGAPLPTVVCDEYCFGGRFAWDGRNYYFADQGNDSSNITYQVYNAEGGNLATHDVVGGAAIDSLYFDWSSCRYTSHDGYGNRSLGDTYTWAAGDFGDDSQTYSPVSVDHAAVGACD